MSTAIHRFEKTRSRSTVTEAQNLPRQFARITSLGVEIPFAIRWSLLLFIFTIPLEATELPGLSSIRQVAALSFFGAFFFYHNPFAKRPLPKIPRPMWWFIPYMAVYLVHGLFLPEGVEIRGQFQTRLMTMFQLIIFCWVAANLLGDRKTMRNVLLTYSAACVILAIGTTLNLPGFSADVNVVSGAERVTAEGYDPNLMAIMLAIAVLGLIGMYLNCTFTYFLTKLAALAMTLPLIYAIVRTGSRSGFVVLVVGFAMFLLPVWKSHRKLAAWGLGAVGAVAVICLFVANPDFSRRWEQVIQEGSTGGRDKIYQISFEMFLERPFFGWGHVGAREELGLSINRSWTQTDPHDLLLEVGLQVGLVGGVPFVIGLAMFWNAAWKARRTPEGVFSTALTTAVLLGSLAVPLLTKKFLWLTLALAIATQIPQQVAFPRISKKSRPRTRAVKA